MTSPADQEGELVAENQEESCDKQDEPHWNQRGFQKVFVVMPFEFQFHDRGPTNHRGGWEDIAYRPHYQ